jgi:hypothetical protein
MVDILPKTVFDIVSILKDSLLHTFVCRSISHAISDSFGFSMQNENGAKDHTVQYRHLTAP